MADVTYWVERGATGGNGLTMGSPWNITEAFAGAITSGGSSLVNIKLPPGGLAYDAMTDVLTVAGNGSQNLNRNLTFRGYNTTPGDMDFGGAFYQSALDAHINGIIAGSVVPIAGDGVTAGLATHLITYAERENIILMNLSLTNLDGATGKGILINSTSSVSDAVIFDNLRLGGAVSGLHLQGTHTLLKNCLTLTTLIDYAIDAQSDIGVHCYGNVFDIAAAKSGFNDIGGGATITGNIFVGGSVGVNSNETTITHNLFYNQTVAGIQVANGNGGLIEHSNIFIPATTADYAVLIPTNGDSVVFSDFSLADPVTGLYSLSGSQFPWYKLDLTEDLHANASKPMGANALTNVNPLLIDPGNKIYTLHDDSPCWNRGLPGVDGVNSHIGPFTRPNEPIWRGRRYMNG